MAQFHDYTDRKFDAKVYDTEYFVGGEKSGYGDYAGCEGIVRDQYRMMSDVMKGRTDKRTALDAACAYGYSTSELNRQGWDAVGFDISEHAIGKAKQLHGDGFHLASAMDSSFYKQFSDKQFGIVTGVEFFEHIESKDVPGVLKQFARVADWGCFVINGRTAPHQGLDSIHGDHGHLNNHLMSWWVSEMAKVGDVDFEAMGQLNRLFFSYNQSIQWHDRVFVVRFN
ncbi:MAG: class I SAM-dependent methyltransferase [Patescibacteria group bacterium]|nr:class I SAM-dependent methyltransferase [Patescibacteria group bacterium]